MEPPAADDRPEPEPESRPEPVPEFRGSAVAPRGDDGTPPPDAGRRWFRRRRQGRNRQ
jgi:hypothetical protein